MILDRKMIKPIHGKQDLFALLNLHTMDYVKVIISLILVLVFYFLFGQESLARLKKGGISISRHEEEPKHIKEPGN